MIEGFMLYRKLLCKMAMYVLAGAATSAFYNDRWMLIGAFVGFCLFATLHAKEI